MRKGSGASSRFFRRLKGDQAAVAAAIGSNFTPRSLLPHGVLPHGPSLRAALPSVGDSIAAAMPDLAECSIVLLAQGIHDVADGDQLLYRECLAALIERDGTIHRAAGFIPHLQAIGALPALDRLVVDLVLDELDYDSTAVLGCNISAASLTSAESWLPLYRQIADRADLAARLVLEVPEALTNDHLEAACAFFARLRDLGCRIAIDDFGAGCATTERLFDIGADIIKVDALFVRDIRGGLNGHGSLYHMVGLAACFAPVVIVEGVERNSQFAASQMAGATHVQGYHFSRPSLLRPPLAHPLPTVEQQDVGATP